MKKKNIPPLPLSDSYHTLKSPIVSLHALLFVVGKNKDIQKNKILSEKVSQMEKKLNLLQERTEIFLNYMIYKEEQIEFLYSFFSLSEVFKKIIEKSLVKASLNYHNEKPILADRDQLQEAFRIVLHQISNNMISKEILISIDFIRGQAVIRFEYIKKIREGDNQLLHSDEHYIAQEQNFIAHKIIQLHGGSIEERQKKKESILKVTLPAKAKARIKK